MSKPIHAKPSLYAYHFFHLKEIALKYGYNLVLHGSMNRDLDLIAIPWQKELGIVDDMIQEFATEVDGYVMQQTVEQRKCFPHGRESFVINLNRMRDKEGNDLQYYIDISVTPALSNEKESDLKAEIEYWKAKHDGMANMLLSEINALKDNNDN